MKKPLITLALFVLILLVIVIVLIRRKFIRGVWIRLFSIVEKGKIDNYHVVEKYNIDKKKDIIISCSLFGDFSNGKKGEKLYTKYFLPILKDGKNVIKKLNNSNIRIYIEPTLSPKLKQELIDTDYEVYVMDKPSKKLGGTFWRFLALSDKKESDIVIISDTDDFFNSDSKIILNTIDSQSLDKWKNTGKKFMLRGEHNIYVPFYANRLCMRDNIIPDISKKMEKYPKENYGADEVFLKREIWPIVKKKGFVRFTSGREKILILGVIVIIIVIVMVIFIKITNPSKKRVF